MMRKTTWAVIAATFSCGAIAAVDSAAAGSTLVISGPDFLPLKSRSVDFGPDVVFVNGAKVSRSIGAVSGAGVVGVSAITNNTSEALVGGDASLAYFWKISSNHPGDKSPVLAHVSTSGSIDATYGYIPLKQGLNFQTANPTSVGVSVDFLTATPTGTKTLSYGVETGALHLGAAPGVEYISAAPLPDAHNGAEVNTHRDFNQSFDIWVMPDVQNKITLQAVIQAIPLNFVMSGSLARQYYQASAFIDPIIEIDLAYAGNYKLEVSPIPTVAVPEPDTLLLTLAGAATVLLATRRTRPSAP